MLLCSLAGSRAGPDSEYDGNVADEGNASVLNAADQDSHSSGPPSIKVGWF